MTLTPGNTPPPAPRKQLSTPPPPPRKPRRGVRKRRRPPRETRSPPACVVCNRKTPLRHNGLCWSLECALQAADHANQTNPTPINHRRDASSMDKLSQPQFLSAHPQHTPVREPHTQFVSALCNIQPQLSHHVTRHQITTTPPQFSTRGETRVRNAEEELDRRSSEEEIQKQDKRVHRQEAFARQEASDHVHSENSQESGASEDNDNEPIAT